MEAKKNRLIVVVSCLLIMGFLTTSLISFFVSRQSLRHQIVDNNLPLTSDNIYSEIQRDLLRPIFISSLMASDTFVRDWIIAGENNSANMIRYLGELLTRYKVFTAFFISDKTKKYYHPNGIVQQVSEDDPEDAWYFRVSKLSEDFEINVDTDDANENTMTVFVNYRVYDYEQKYIGVTGVGLKVDAVKKLIASYEDRYDRLIYFIDKDGAVTLSGKHFPKGLANIFSLEGFREKKTELFQDDRRVITLRHDGNLVHVAMRYIPEFDWYLVVEESEAGAIENVLDSLFINLAICGLVIVVVLAFTNMTITAFQRRLEKMATTDKLTGIYNRRAFELIMEQTLREVKRSGEPFTLVLLDIDLFKNVNDTFGHLAGDKVIQELVDVSKMALRNSDIICRWGGEEFLVVLRECEGGDGKKIAEKLRVAVENNNVEYKGNDIKISVSMGVSQYKPDELEDALLSRVDKALYKAKQNGRNQVVLL